MKAKFHANFIIQIVLYFKFCGIEISNFYMLVSYSYVFQLLQNREKDKINEVSACKYTENQYIHTHAYMHTHTHTQTHMLLINTSLKFYY